MIRGILSILSATWSVHSLSFPQTHPLSSHQCSARTSATCCLIDMLVRHFICIDMVPDVSDVGPVGEGPELRGTIPALFLWDMTVLSPYPPVGSFFPAMDTVHHYCCLCCSSSCCLLSISLWRYQAAFCRSCRGSPLWSHRKIYLIAFPRQKFICSVICIVSTPLGCWV